MGGGGGGGVENQTEISQGLRQCKTNGNVNDKNISLKRGHHNKRTMYCIIGVVWP